VSAWFKAPTSVASSDHATIYGEGNSSLPNPAYQIYIDENTKQLRVWYHDDTIGGGGLILQSTSAYNDNVWHHVVAVHSASNSHALYIDGNQVTTSSTNVGTITLNAADIGALENGSAARTQLFTGLIDDVRIYSRALSATEVSDLYHQGQVTIGASQASRISNGLVGYWSFNGYDLSGTTAYDRSAQGNNATLTNGPVPTIGKLGQALQFNGTNNYVAISDANSLDLTSNGTISLWAMRKGNNLPGTFTTSLIDKGNSDTNAAHNYSISAGKTSFGVACNLGNGVTVNSSAAYSANDNDWYNITCAWDSSNIYLYINGSLYDTTALSITPTTNGEQLIIGKAENNPTADEYFNGLIDDVRVYNRALSADEVYKLYLGR
jgi:hypothetical protein